jgi:predicted nucleic acid-binding protein
MMWLVDTSVVLAAVLGDEGSHQRACTLLATLRRSGTVHAADHLPQEFLNGLSKAIRRERLDAAGARAALRFWMHEPWQWIPIQPHLRAVLDEAAAGHGHTYDLLHLHAAHASGARLLTADRKFVTGAVRHPWRRTLLHIEDAKALNLVR